MVVNALVAFTHEVYTELVLSAGSPCWIAYALSTYNKPQLTRTVLQILFQISQKNAKEANPWNPKRDFLIEIHMEKGSVRRNPFLDFAFYWEIRNPDLKIEIRISQSNAPIGCGRLEAFTILPHLDENTVITFRVKLYFIYGWSVYYHI